MTTILLLLVTIIRILPDHAVTCHFERGHGHRLWGDRRTLLPVGEISLKACAQCQCRHPIGLGEIASIWGKMVGPGAVPQRDPGAESEGLETTSPRSWKLFATVADFCMYSKVLCKYSIFTLRSSFVMAIRKKKFVNRLQLLMTEAHAIHARSIVDTLIKEN